MKNIFVFPCGSEVALEVARSLEGDRHFHLIGGASVKDHGRFVFDDIVQDVPWIDSDDFVPYVKKIVAERKIDLVYPATDMAIVALKRAEKEHGVPVVSPSLKTAETCLSKRKTYDALKGVVRLPKMFSHSDTLPYPVFAKPEVGHSSMGTAVLRSEAEMDDFLSKNKNVLLLELLPGEEYTVDCFTDRHGRLLFSGARVRQRVSNGISVGTYPVPKDQRAEFSEIAAKINQVMQMRGAWFVQLKRNGRGELTLLEVAARFGGSSGLYRGLGVNFAMLSIWDAFGFDVSVVLSDFEIEMDRALDNKYKLHVEFDEIFLDYDDTIVMSDTGKINPKVMQLVFSCINRGVKVTVLSRHRGDLMTELKARKIDGLFTRVIHISEDDDKAAYIDNKKAIFIDDSHAERANVLRKTGIVVFGLDMLDALI